MAARSIAHAARRIVPTLTLPVVFGAGCGASPAPTAPASSPKVATATPPSSSAAAAPKGALTVPEARRYMLELINRDRRSMGLTPVTLDEGPSMRAAQGHAEDMAENGYLGHWGTDGSVPEQRMTEAGGASMVLENASCFTDEQHRSLDHSPHIDPEQVEHTESMFFHEVPPNDGHRRNILKPWHTKVGIGIAQPRATPTEIPVPCVSQEFVDDYGTYAPLPKEVRVGARVHVEGTLSGIKPAGVGLARVDFPKALTPRDANARRSYPVPAPYETYWPSGFKTPIPVVINGQRFAIDVPMSDAGKPGLYEVSVWAKPPGSNDFQVVSLRTIRVLPKADD
jgi:uncharacterized protein YkwD